MKSSCQAIVLRQFNYSDTSVIISCFTKEFGVKSFLYKGGKKKNSSVLLPLRIVEINYYQHKEHSLANANTIFVANPLVALYQNPIKSSVLFFMSDFLNQLLSKIQYTETNLFQEIQQELIWLNESEEFANYPIFWMIQWIEKMGIKPVVKAGNFFDIEGGQILSKATNSLFFFQGEEIIKLAQMFQSDRLNILSISLTKKERTVILDALISYCKFHIPEFNKFKSVEILQAVLG